MLLAVITRAFAFSDSNVDAVAYAWAVILAVALVFVSLGF